MKTSPTILAVCLSILALCFSANAGAAKLFTVPFFIENLNATAPPALRADFTLTKSATLETFSMTCAGAPRGGILYVDGGPAGVNGTTGVGATADVGLVVGLISGLMEPTQIVFSVDNGVYYFPPTHLGLPVKQKYSFIVFPNAPNTVQCNGIVVFSTSIDTDD